MSWLGDAWASFNFFPKRDIPRAGDTTWSYKTTTVNGRPATDAEKQAMDKAFAELDKAMEHMDGAFMHVSAAMKHVQEASHGEPKKHK